MSDPTPSLTLSIALSRSATEISKVAGAIIECHTSGRDVRETYLSAAHRALRDATDAIHAFRMAEIDAVERRMQVAE